MTDKALRCAQRGYYLSFVMMILAIGAGFLLRPYVQLDKASESGIAVQSIAFILLLSSLPGILWWFHRRVGQLQNLADLPEREKIYTRMIVIRLAVVNVNVILNILLFFFFSDKSFFMCAAIAAIILLFCRPNARNIEQELGLAVPEEEDKG